MFKNWKDAIVWVAIIGIIGWSVIQTSGNNRDIARVQDGMAQNAQCTETYLTNTVKALNERTTYSISQANANAHLQQAQLTFIQVLLDPAAGDNDGRIALNNYFDALKRYNRLTALSVTKQVQYKYPSATEYRNCLAGKTRPNKKDK